MDASLITAAVELATEFLKRRADLPTKDVRTVRSKVDRHLREALKWSNRIQFYGMSQAEETELATVPLRLAREPRRFQGVAHQPRTEDVLLGDDRNYLLLGEPGAGKTTTLKRLVRTLLLEPPKSETDVYQFPVVVRLRELESDETVVEAIAKALGFPVTEREDARKKTSLWLFDTRLDHAVAEFLNSGHVVLILDGLDEVPIDAQARIRREASWLALNAEESKVVATCRSGDYTTVIEGFDLLEICPLGKTEIKKIASGWLADPATFLRQLDKVPYQDVVDRPLLLTQLLYLYKRYGYLPEQPAQVYRKVIGLLLHEWDAEREIVRRSKYAGFDPDRKAAFLAALAYYLTFRIRRKVFTEQEMVAAYLSIHDRFGLPREEAKQVIGEVETHTGIVAVASPTTFEFAHLSIQEYLCADYMIREPLAEHLGEYMAEYPAPVAIAVALSSNPSVSFAALFLKTNEVSLVNVHSFLSRLLLERPFFGVSPLVGAAVGRLFRDVSARPETVERVGRLAELPNVAKSIDEMLNSFYPAPEQKACEPRLVRLNRTQPIENARGFRTPDWIYVPESLLESLAAQGSSRAKHFVQVLRKRAGA